LSRYRYSQSKRQQVLHCTWSRYQAGTLWVNANPVICKGELTTRSDLRHVAIHTALPGNFRAMTEALVARGATLIIFGGPTRERRVRIMASQTGECSITFTKANGVTEVIRLVTRVPGVRPVGLFSLLRRFPMTRTTKDVQLARLESAWVLDSSRLATRSNMSLTGAVTGFAMNAQFRWFYAPVRAETQRTSSVTSKTPQNRRTRVESTVPQPFDARVPGRQCQRFRGGVITQAVLEIPFGRHLADIRSRFETGAKGPVARATRRGQRQRLGMFALRLFLKLMRMARPAGLAAYVLSRGGRAQEQECRKSTKK
jgi:hypothetical protein